MEEALAGIDSGFSASALPMIFFRPYGAGFLGGSESQGLRPGLFSSLPPGGLMRSEVCAIPGPSATADEGPGAPIRCGRRKALTRKLFSEEVRPLAERPRRFPGKFN